jgi:oligopeptide transport system substrate-binding protein
MKRCLWLLVAAAFVTASCTGKKRIDETKDGKAFTVQIITEPPTLDWNKSNDSVSADILFNLMEGLTGFNDNLELQPALAKSWIISPDGKKYTFKLRENALWSDGKPLKAQQFVDSWLRLLDPKTASEYAYFLFDVKGAREFNENKGKASDIGVKAIDDGTLEVTLRAPAAYFLPLLAFWVTFPVRMDIIQQYGDSWHDAGKSVSIGPYRLAEWAHDSHVIIKANPHYWGGPVSIPEVHFIVVNDSTTAISLFDTGKIDLVRAEVPALERPRFEGTPNLKMHSFLRMYYYGFNVLKKPFDNPKVRRAFAMSVDKDLFPKILKGNQIPRSSWIPEGMLGYNPAIGFKTDVAAAKKLLAEAGYPEGKGFPSVVMMYDTRDENKTIAEALQQMWRKNLNVDLKIETQEWKVFLKLLTTDKGPPMFRMGWGADFPDPDNFMNLFTSYSGNNNNKWKNPQYDKLIADGAKEQNPDKRKAIYDKAQKLLLEEGCIMVPLFQQAIGALVSSRVKEAPLNAMNILMLKNWKL